MQRNTLALGGVVLFGLLAIIVTVMALRGGQQAPPPAQTQAPTSVTQWVAAREIPRRTRIERSMLTPRTIEGDKAVEGAITDPSDVVGKVVNATIPAGKVVTTTLVRDSVQPVTPAVMPVPVGLRAVAIWVNPDQTAAGLVDVGDRVDVVANHKIRVKTPAGDNGEIVSGRTIAQFLEVLAIDRSIEVANAANAQPTPGAAPGAPGAPPPAAPPPPPPGQEKRVRIILAAAPAIAERLVAANQQGILHVIIRNPNDRPTLPVPEALEYPIRVAGDPQAAARAEKLREEQRQEERQLRQEARADARQLRQMQMTARMTGGGRNNASGAPMRPMPPMPVPNPFPNPPGGSEQRPPAPSSEKEVTVIRGTEKTRVIVPPG